MMTSDKNVSRREAVRSGLGLVGVVVVVVFAGASRGARAQAGKLAKSAVQYTDAGTVKGMDCDDCIQFLPAASAGAAGTCKVVEGEINPHGHCLAFSPRPKS